MVPQNQFQFFQKVLQLQLDSNNFSLLFVPSLTYITTFNVLFCVVVHSFPIISISNLVVSCIHSKMSSRFMLCIMNNIASVSSSFNTRKIFPFFFLLYSFPFLTSNVFNCFCLFSLLTVS